MTTVLCVPQWQGSGHGRAPRLVAGAHRTAELVQADARVTVPVLDGAGTYGAGVRALDVLVENLRLTRVALADIDDLVITAGGDCGVDLAPIVLARARYGDQLTVIWFDAHPDLYTPATLPSGSFHGMVLRTLLGDGPAPLVPQEPLVPAQVIIAGVRAGDESEHKYLEKCGIRKHGVKDLERVVDGLNGPVYVHLDLDVLDPVAFGSLCYPEPDGVQPQDLIDVISQMDNVVGAAITEHAPLDGDVDSDSESESESESEAEIIRKLAAAFRA